MTSGSDVKALKQRIQDLEIELADRERDLARFRTELGTANSRIEKILSEMTHELKIAGLIQRALVPTEFPNIPGFEFSTKFQPSMISGGDYFDIFEHEDKFRFGVVMANSSGYSMSALFLSILMKMTGQLEAKRGTPPQQVLTMMARELIPNIQTHDEAHVFYAVFDRRSFELSFSSAGSCVALLQKFSEGTIEKLVGDAPAFAKGFGSELHAQTFSLNPRDRVIICSTGSVLAQNPAGEAFGEERLLKAVLLAPKTGVHELRNEILYAIEKFCGGRELPKDVTVIVCEVKDRVIKLAKNIEN